jgi:hypothetical protein
MEVVKVIKYYSDEDKELKNVTFSVREIHSNERFALVEEI